MSNRLPAWKRLQEMPAVFTLAELRETQDMSDSVAKVSVARWSSQGLVKAAGPRVGVYYNLVVAPDAPSVAVGRAAKVIFEEVVLVGPTVLHDAGWTTQIPHVLTVAVLESRTHPAVDGLHLHARPQAWFDRIHSAGGALAVGRGGMKTLTAEWALADMMVHTEARCGLQPDDVEIPSEAELDQLRSAIDTFFVQDDVSGPFLRASGVQLNKPSRGSRVRG